MMPHLNNNTFIRLRDFIYQKTGIFFSDNRQYLLENKLSHRLLEKNCGNFEEYYNILKFDPEKEREYAELYNSITINETSFFREEYQLKIFEKNLLPRILEKKKKEGKRSLWVWSAGCSTGEEPYTLAMILLENTALTKGLNLEILASDLSEQAINSARKGIYGSYSLRHLPKKYLNKYFLRSGELFSVRPEVKKLVRFSNINLYDYNRIKNIRRIDFIFCRNVIIYFAEQSRKQIVNSLYESLNPGGYLFIGLSESLVNVTRAFKLHNINRCILYEKV